MLKTHKKFALIGTSCVGKTTLITKLYTTLQETRTKETIALAPEAARLYFSHIHTKNPFSFYHQSRIQTLAKQLEVNAEKETTEIILCDRSVIDSAAYVHTTESVSDAKKLLDRMNNWLLTYTHFFLLDPVGVPYQTDMIRKETAETRNKFHESFLFLLKKSNLPFSLISGTIDHRLQTMVQIISS